MNNNIMSVVFASDSAESKLNELTIHRTTASLPFCGRYRFIDFTLSNLVNSNITTIGIITKSNYSSLMDHIRGNAVLPPASVKLRFTPSTIIVNSGQTCTETLCAFVHVSSIPLVGLVVRTPAMETVCVEIHSLYDR